MDGVAEVTSRCAPSRLCCGGKGRLVNFCERLIVLFYQTRLAFLPRRLCVRVVCGPLQKDVVASLLLRVYVPPTPRPPSQA
jgi:hypothetical protein